jgi:hypothetical protein
VSGDRLGRREDHDDPDREGLGDEPTLEEVLGRRPVPGDHSQAGHLGHDRLHEAHQDERAESIVATQQGQAGVRDDTGAGPQRRHPQRGNLVGQTKWPSPQIRGDRECRG